MLVIRADDTGECCCRAPQRGLQLKQVLRAFEARDVNSGSRALIEPGALLDSCRVVRVQAQGCEPYEMEFDWAGRRYAAPLFVFQPRTEFATASAAKTRTAVG